MDMFMNSTVPFSQNLPTNNAFTTNRILMISRKRFNKRWQQVGIANKSLNSVATVYMRNKFAGRVKIGQRKRKRR
jgi:hypothetical protein